MPDKPSSKRPDPPAYLAPAEYEAADIEALQALAQGVAPEHLQKRALAWIINSAARTYDLSFSPETDRGTSFAEGRRFVGLQIVKMLKLKRGS